MTSLRSSVRPKSSKQPWGTILVPEFGLGYQKMTSYETDQTVKRLYHIRHTRDQLIERPHTATLDKAGEKEMVSAPYCCVVISNATGIMI